MNKIKNCIKGKDYNGYPVWFMRQAGRYLPEFNEIRNKNPDFINLCLNEKLSAEISIQPLKRFDLDAAIIFSDILIVPHALNQKVKFIKKEGPILSLDIKAIINTDKKSFLKTLNPTYKAIKLLKKQLPKNKSLISFIGAPWTLLVYMFNKKSPKNNFNLKTFLKNNYHESKLNIVLQKLEMLLPAHIDKQIEAGADIIQIFDSWAGLLNIKNESLQHFCYEPTIKLVNHIKSRKIPVICFPRGIGLNYIDFVNKVKPDCISIDSEVDPIWAKKNFNNIPIQGGLDPKVLLFKKKKEIKLHVLRYLETFQNYPYIFNLGHGVLPETKPEIIEYIIQIVRNKNKLQPMLTKLKR